MVLNPPYVAHRILSFKISYIYKHQGQSGGFSVPVRKIRRSRTSSLNVSATGKSSEDKAWLEGGQTTNGSVEDGETLFHYTDD